MRAVAARIEELRGRQREMVRAGKARGVEVLAMSRVLGILRQSAYSWLED